LQTNTIVAITLSYPSFQVYSQGKQPIYSISYFDARVVFMFQWRNLALFGFASIPCKKLGIYSQKDLYKENFVMLIFTCLPDFCLMFGIFNVKNMQLHRVFCWHLCIVRVDVLCKASFANNYHELMSLFEIFFFIIKHHLFFCSRAKEGNFYFSFLFFFSSAAVALL
jgi:hypothetical protein